MFHKGILLLTPNCLFAYYTPIRFRAQTLSSAITGGFKYAKLHLIYSHTMIQAVHRQLYLFTLHKMLNSLLLCSRMAPRNGDLYVLQTESVYSFSINFYDHNEKFMLTEL